MKELVRIQMEYRVNKLYKISKKYRMCIDKRKLRINQNKPEIKIQHK